ncbi:MAG: hypothetical protein MUP69_10285 [Candidatus Atribacteria bacterium]|nr:hypothetical protein [Candidatus Atribacteria bacterium]
MQYTDNLILKLPEATDTSKVRTDLNFNWAILDELVQAVRIFRMTIIDIKAADTDGIHAAINGTGATQEITVGITNPDEPRNGTITCSNIAGSSGVVTLTGLVRGVSDTEALTIILGVTVKGNKAFDTITKIDIPATLEVGDNLQVGFGDKVGLTHEISAVSKVYKVKINAVDVTSTYVTSKVNATYGTIDFSVISAYQDITIFYLGD